MTKISHSVVTDASYILQILLPDETIQADQVPHQMSAPTLLSYEVANALRSATLQKRIPVKLANEIYEEYLHLPITLYEPNFTSVIKLAVKQHLSVYDACYLDLATQLKIPLYTLDKELQKLS